MGDDLSRSPSSTFEVWLRPDVYPCNFFLPTTDEIDDDIRRYLHTGNGDKEVIF